MFGVVVAALLFPGQLEVANGIRLDVHTFLVAAIAVLLGVQNLTFGLIAHRFAIRYGLLPRPKRNSRLLALLTFERGLVVAALLAVFGMAGLAWSLITWASVDFGPLEYPAVLRTLIVSLTSIAIGLQLAFTAFLSAIIRIFLLGENRHSPRPNNAV